MAKNSTNIFELTSHDLGSGLQYTVPGPSTDFEWKLTAGSSALLWSNFAYDVLENCREIHFDDLIVAIDDAGQMSTRAPEASPVEGDIISQDTSIDAVGKIEEPEDKSSILINVSDHVTDRISENLYVSKAWARSGEVAVNDDATLTYWPSDHGAGRDEISLIVNDGQSSSEVRKIRLENLEPIVELGSQFVPDQFDVFDADVSLDLGGYLADLLLDEGVTVSVDGLPLGLAYNVASMRIEGKVVGDLGDSQAHSVDVSIRSKDRQLIKTHFKWVVRDGSAQDKNEAMVRAVPPISSQSDAAGAAILYSVASQSALAAQAFMPTRTHGESNKVANSDGLQLAAISRTSGQDGTSSSIGFEAADLFALQVETPKGVEPDHDRLGELETAVPPIKLNTDEPIGSVSDSLPATGSGSSAIPVAGIESGASNEAPFAGTPPTIVSPEDQVASNIDVLAAAFDTEGDGLSVSGAAAEHGSVTVNDDGTLSYTPDLNFNGSDTITYTIIDAAGNSALGSLEMTIMPVNDAPLAGTVAAQATNEDMPVATGVVSAASDVDGDTLLVSTASASNGFVIINADQTLTYSPLADFNGTDTITYAISDGNGGIDIGSYTVTIAPVNDAPRPVADSAIVVEDGSISIDILANDTDIDGTIDPATVHIVGTAAPGDSLAMPGEGNWSVDPATGWVTFVPEVDYDGPVSPVSYTVQDDSGATSNPIAISVSITSVNDAPVAVANSGTAIEDGSVTLNVLSNDSDLDSLIDPTTVQIVGTAAAGDPLTVPGEGVWSVDGGTGEITFVPETNFTGPVTDISYTVRDVDGLTSNAAALSVSITPVNDAPVASADSDSVVEDGAIVVDVLANDSDLDGSVDPTTVQITGAALAGDSLIVPGEGVWSVNTITGEITFTPETDYTGAVTDITYSVADDGGLISNTATVAVSIVPVNDAPVAVADSDNVFEDGSVSIDALANDTDIDGTLDPATVQITGTALAGDPLLVAGEGVWSVNTITGEISFTPEADFTGPVTDITYTVRDDAGLTSNPISVSVTITAANDAPVSGAVPDAGVNEDAFVANIDVLSFASDVEGDSLIVTTASAINGTVTINPDSSLNYTPDPNYNGTDVISYELSDGNGGTSSGALDVIVAPLNDDPVAGSPPLDSTDEDTAAISLDVLSYASDIDGDVLSVTGPTAVHGIVSVNPDGTLHYMPDLNFNGVDTITYTIDDGNGGTVFGSKLVFVAAVNDAPVASADVNSVTEDGSVTINVLGNDNDVDDGLDPATVQIAGTALAGDPLVVPGEGTWSVNVITGEISFAPEPNYTGTVADITYTVMDNSGVLSNPATISVSIVPSNDAPVTVDDADIVAEDGSVVIDVLANDSDIDNLIDPTTVQITGTALAGDPLVVAGEGVWTINPVTGEITFTPEADFDGAVSDITYTVLDVGGIVSNPATVSVSITPVNDAPNAVADSDSVLEDAVIAIDVLANDVDIDGTLDPATVQITGTASAGDPLVVAGEGTWSINIVTGEISFAPEPNYTGTVADITYTVMDDSGAVSNPATVSASISSVNDAPVAADDADIVAEDGSVVIDVLANDSDIDNLIDPTTVQITGTALAGDPLVVAGEGVWTINPVTGEITFTPEADFDGAVSDITYTVLDVGGLVSNPATVSVFITPVNDAPNAVADSDSVLEDAAIAIDVLANDVDIDGSLDPATVQITGTASAGDPLVVAGEGTWSVNIATGEISFSPEADYAGTVTDITYTVMDDSGAVSNPATVSVTITPVNDTPITADDVDVVLEDGSVAIDVLVNDIDLDGTLDPASVQITGTALAGDPLVVAGEGIWTVNPATGEITFTPEPDYIGAVTDISYTVRDDSGATSNASIVSMSITDTNDAPVLDLDSGVGGVGSSSTFVEDAGSVAVASANVLVLDPENSLSRIIVTLDAVLDGANELLTVNTSTFALDADSSGSSTLGSGLQIAYNYTAATRELIVTHIAGAGTMLTSTNVEEAIEALAYENLSDAPTTGDRRFTIVLEDEGALTSPPTDAVVTVQATNDAPTDMTFAAGGIDENSAPSSVATTIATVDPDTGDSFTYALTSDSSGFFEISGNQIVVKSGATIDFETSTSYDVTVEVTDSGGLTYSEAFTIVVNDVNEAPTDIDGAANTGTAINTDGGNAAYYQATDGSALIGGLTEFTFETQFAIDDPSAVTSIELFSYFAGGGSDEIQLAIGDLSGPSPYIYFELNKSSDVHVAWNAAELLDGAQHTVSFAWSNTFGDWSFFMDGVEVASGTGHEVGEVLDPGGVLIFGKDQDATGGGLTTGEGFAGTFYDIRLFDDVRTPAEIQSGANATLPPSSPNMIANWQFGVDGTDDIVDTVSGNDLILNQATGSGFTPSTPIAMVGLSEASADGTVVATLSVSDVDAGDSHTFTITSDPSGFFEIVGNELRVATGAAFDYDIQEVHSVTVQAEDSGGLTTSQVFNIDVLNEVDNLAPTDLEAIGINGTSINHDGGNAAYYSPDDSSALFGGMTTLTVEAQFAVQDYSGLTDLPMLNYLVGTSEQFDFRIVNPNGSPQIRARIDGQNAFPSWDASPLLDGNVHTISFAWTSFGGVWEMYIDGVRLDNGTGLANGSSLDFGGNLVIGIDQDTAGGSFETDQVFTGTYYDIRIFDDLRTATEIALNAGESVVSTEDGLVANWQFGEGGGSQIVDVVGGNNLNLGQAPGVGFTTITPESTLGIFQNAPDGSFIASLSAVDPNFNESFTYATTSDPSGNFEIVGDQLVVATGASMDFATDPFHTITIEVTDEGGLTYSENVTIAVLNDSGFIGGTPTQIVGTPNPDTLVGTAEGEFIFGLGDDDIIYGNGGNDAIHGHDGSDTIEGGAGDDVIFADRESQASDLVDPVQHIINTDTSGNQSGPSVVALADGRMLVTWYDQAQENNDHQSRVQGQFVNPDGTLDGSQFEFSNIEVEGRDLHDMPLMNSTLLATGDVLVTWVTESQHDQDGDGEALFGVVVDTSGGGPGLPFQINQTSAGPQSGTSVTAMEDGRAMVVWYDEGRDGGTNAQVHGRIVNPDGTVTTPEFDIGSFGVTGIDFTDMPPLTSVALATGSVYVSWASFGDDNVDGSGSAVIGVLVNPTTGIAGEETIINDYATGHQSPPVAIALDDGGVFLVYYGDAWNDNDGDMTLKGRFVDAGGDLDGPEIDIGTAYIEGNPVYDMPPLTAVKNADGDVLVSWLEDNTLGSDIVANLIDVSTHSVGADLQISDPTGNRLSAPVLVALGDGRILATWYERGDFDDVSGMVVKAQILNSDGSQSGSQLDVGSYPVEGDDAIDMPPLTATLMIDGNVMISWETDDWADVTGGGNGSEVVSVIVKTKSTAGADVVSGDSGDDIISGGDGDDRIDGGSGADSLDGGDGVDIVSFSSATSGVTALFEDADAGGIDGAYTGASAGGKTGDAAGDTYLSFERVEGSDFDDAFYGTATGMSATLGYGDDQFDNDAASIGIDTILGGFGSDTIHTGAGDDYLSGGAGSDSLFGEDGDDTLDGGEGADLINGGSGFDTASYINATSGVDLLLTAADAFGIDGAYANSASGGQTGEAAGDTFVSVERVVGSDHNDRIFGLNTGTTVELGAGDDVFDNDSTQVAVDDISGGDGNDIIRTGDGDDIITGEQGNDNLRGEGGDDLIYGGDDSDLIAGGMGDDTADGGADTDTYYANGFRADFTLIDNLDGTYNLRDDRPGSPEGNDLLTNIELIEYWDQIVGVNNPLSLDLDDTAAGSGYTTSFTEGGGAVSITDTDVVSADPESSLSFISVVVSNMHDGSDDVLSINGNGISLDSDAAGSTLLASGLTIAYSYSATTGELLINHQSGPATLLTNAQVEEALESLTYENLSEEPTEIDREFVVVLQDMDGNQSPAAISTVAILGVNDVPVAVGESDTVNQNASVTIDVLANDSDVDGTLVPATVQIVGTTDPGDSLVVPGEGIWSVNTSTGEITFTPDAAYSGAVTDISYTVQDDQGGVSNPATISMSIIAANVAPSLDLDNTSGGSNYATTFTEGMSSIKITGLNTQPTDIENSLYSITVTLDAIPDGSSEVLTVNSPTFSLASDNAGMTTLGSGLQASYVYTAATRELVLTNFAGPGDPLTVANAEEILESLSYRNASEDPTAGIRTFTVVLEDDQGLTSTPVYATIDVIAVNDAPVAVADSVTVPEDGMVIIDVLANDSDVDGTLDPATVQITGTASAGDPLVVAGEGEWKVNTLTGEILFAPEPSYDGAVTDITYTVQDDLGATSSPATVSVSITGTNDAPHTPSDYAVTLEDNAVVIDVLANDFDIDGTLDPTSVQITGTTSAGDPLVVAGEGTWTINPATGQITFTPEADHDGSVTDITYTVRDDLGAVSTPVVWTDTNSYWRLEGGGVDAVGGHDGVVSGTTTVAGDTGSALSFDELDDQIVISDFGLNNEFTLSFKIKIDDNTGSLFQYIYSHGDINTTNSLNVFLNEDSHGSDPNQLRTVIRDTDDTLDNTALQFDASAIIGDGNWHTYTLTVESGVGATVYLDGILQATDATRGGDAIDPITDLNLGARYDSDPDRFFGGALDSVHLLDRSLTSAEVESLHLAGSESGQVHVDITPVNDAPVAGDETLNVNEDLTGGRNVLADDFDVDGTLDPATIQIGGTASAGDPLVVAGEGTWTVNTVTGVIRFTPELNYTGPVTDITYTVQDDQGAVSNPATFSYNIIPVNDAPHDLDATSTSGLGSSEIVNTTTADSQRLGTSAAMLDGGYVTTWYSMNQDGNGHWDIYAQRFDSAGEKTGTEFRVNTDDDNHQFWSDVAGLTGGGFVISWLDFSEGGVAGEYGVHYQVYDASGNTVGSEANANTTTLGQQFPSDIVGTDDGGFVLTWRSENVDGDGMAVITRKFDATGAPLSAEIQVNTTTLGDQSAGALAALPGGGYLVAWQSENVDAAGTAIVFQRFDAAGGKIGGEIQANTTTLGDQAAAYIAMLSDGGFIVAWTSNDHLAGDGSGVYFQRYDVAGSPVGGEVTIDEAGGAIALSDIQVEGLPGGGWITSWRSNADGDFDVFMERYAADGTLIEDNVVVTNAADEQRYPRLAVLNNGDAVFNWTDINGADGDLNGVYQLIYANPEASPRVSENAGAGTVVASLTTSDVDIGDTFTYALTSDPSGFFEIVGDEIRVKAGATIDYETANTHAVTVESTDSGGLTTSKSFNITVADENDNAPTGILASGNIGTSINTDAGNAAYFLAADGGALLGGLSTFTVEVQYSLDAPLADGEVAPIFNYHSGGTDQLEVSVTNDTGTSPTPFVTLEVAGSAINIVAWDASQMMDGAQHTIAATWDNTAGNWELFLDGISVASGSGIATAQTIAGGGFLIFGQEQDSPNGSFNTDQEFRGTYNDVRIFDDVRSLAEISAGVNTTLSSSTPNLIANWRFEDSETSSVTDHVGGNNLSLNQVSEPGFSPSTPQSVVSVVENSVVGTVVANLSTIDADPGDTFTYTITSDPSGFFEIVGNEVRVKAGAALDYENANSHNVTIQVTDSAGLTYSEVITILVTNSDQETSGTAAADLIQGTPNSETIIALGGADFVYTQGDNDIVLGGAGNDILHGQDGSDTIYGGSEDDLIYGDRQTVASDTVGSQSLTNTHSTGDQSAPLTVALADGSMLVVWYDGAMLNPDPSMILRGQIVQPNGTKVGSEFVIGTTYLEGNNIFDAPPLSMDRLTDGNVFVAWQTDNNQSYDGDQTSISGSVIDVSTMSAGAEIQINTNGAGFQTGPIVTTLDDGRALVVWYENGTGDNSTMTISAQFMNADGTKNGAQMAIGMSAVSGDNLRDMPPVAVEKLTDGNVYVAWSTNDSISVDGSGSAVAGVLVEVATSTAGSETIINTTIASNQSGPVIVALENGEFFVAWYDNAESSNNVTMMVRGQFFNKDGTPKGSEIAIGTWAVDGTDGNDLSPLTAIATADGNVLVGWQSEGSLAVDGADSAAVAALVNTAAQTAGAEFVINTTSALAQSAPIFVALHDGRIFATWIDDSDLDSSGLRQIRAQMLNADGSKDGGELMIGVSDAEGNDNIDMPPLTAALTMNGDVFISWQTDDSFNADGDGSAVASVLVQTRTSAGNDVLFGEDGDDTISGGAGNDTADGGTGTDTYVANGANADFTLVDNNDGTFTLTDIRGGSPQGADTLSEIEYIQYTDQTDSTGQTYLGDSFSNIYTGTSGADYIDGDSGGDTLDGAFGSDTILGGTGDDTLTGGPGDDIIDPGAGGSDVVIYTGNRADYTIHDNQDGTFVITDNRGGSPDGIDTLLQAADLQFADQLIDIASAVTAVSPIALDLNRDGRINVTGETTAKDKSDISGIGDTVYFDMDGNDDLETIEWLDGTGDALLVNNVDGNAMNDMNGTRLFGDQGGTYDHGYQQLAEFDSNSDNVITEEEFVGLNLWIDDGNARVDKGELFTLQELGVSEIELSLNEDATDDEGRDLFQSSATLEDGSRILTEDVWFAQEIASSEEERYLHPEQIDV